MSPDIGAMSKIEIRIICENACIMNALLSMS